MVADSLTLDTLSIMPKTFTLSYPDGSELDTGLYTINYGSAVLTPHPGFPLNDSLRVGYSVFPFLIEGSSWRRDYSQHLSPDSLMGREPQRYSMPRTSSNPFGEGINASGTFMRGISFGNNQGLTINSSMNIQLSGEIGESIMVEGAISDQTVPLQPDGNTYRLQEFDRVYLKVSSDNFAIQAGDIEMRTPRNDALLTFRRNVQGLLYSGNVVSGRADDTLTVEAGAAVARGKFARNQIAGVEGNQGPYRLQGAEGELYIMVIAGSERVYIDGVLLQRGEDRHYTIDYNLAEVFFTPLVPVSRSCRIVVEFEYSERSYVRFNTYANLMGTAMGWDWRFSAFSESDSRNQPYDQDLTEDHKRLLSSIGDNLTLAFSPQMDSVGFTADQILYQTIDTLVMGVSHTIFKHSNNPLNAHYRVFFSFVGAGRGSYLPDYGSANGRVFRWVAPANGVEQGSYAPVRKLVTPKTSQSVTLGVGREWERGTGVVFDYAVSNTDLNTFSALDSHDDIGHAIKSSLSQGLFGGSLDSGLAVGASLVATSPAFRYIDRFREQEFERSWAVGSPLTGADERQADVWVQLALPKRLNIRAIAEGLLVDSTFQGLRARLTGWQRGSWLGSKWDASYLQAHGPEGSTSFLRGRAGVTKPFERLDVGLETEYEGRSTWLGSRDTLAQSSFMWYMLRLYAQMPDTLPQRLGASYSIRNDYKYPEGVQLQVGTSHEVAAIGQSDAGRLGMSNASIGYRNFDPTETGISLGEKRESTLLGRLEYSNRFVSGFWTFSGGYELGSGLENENEYFFVEVPAGQGLYTWIDYNGNGVKEIDEFEVSPFPDEARYIRVNLPSQRTVRVRTNALSLRSNLNPSVFRIKGSGLLAQLAKLSNQTSYTIRNRNRIEDFMQSANPFPTSELDSLVVSMASSVRNSLAWNRTNRSYGAEYAFIRSQSRISRVNGWEQKASESHRLIAWLGLWGSYSLRAEGEILQSLSESRQFPHRDYHISSMNPTVSLRRTDTYGITSEVGYKRQDQRNLTGAEVSVSNTIFAQVDMAYPTWGSLMVKTSLVGIRFEGNPQTAVAFEMLRGLQPGRNAVWEVSARRRLTALFELELGYSGRYLAIGRTVHTGSMMARALF